MDLVGKYVKNCKVFTENIEESALKIIYKMLDHPCFKDAKIRIMPDVHAGKGCVIGFSSELTDYVNPEYVGCDIGCQMTTMLLDRKIDELRYADIDRLIKEHIPMGFEINKELNYNIDTFHTYLDTSLAIAKRNWPDMINYEKVDERYIIKILNRLGMSMDMFYKSIGSLGGGNHFIEYGENDELKKYGVTVHCGSRNFGQKVFGYWNKIAKNQKLDSNEFRSAVEELKKTISDKTQIHSQIEKLKVKMMQRKPTGFLTGENMKGYITDIAICQAYASFNHLVIIDEIEKILNEYGIYIIDTINCIHNYISTEDHIIRKGAISAHKKELSIIPFNMRDGLAICYGKGNPDWNYTAPHGAGRVMGRGEASRKITMDEYQKSMKGIYSSSINRGTIDESPMVYKNYHEILELIEPTVEVLFLLKPKINIKASEFPNFI